MKPVEVVWVDIEELSGGWHDQDEVDKFYFGGKKPYRDAYRLLIRGR